MMKINVEFYVGTQKEADLVGRALALVAAELPKEHLPVTCGSVGTPAETAAPEAPVEAPKARKKAEKPAAEEAETKPTDDKPKKAAKAKAVEGPTLKEVNDAFAELLDKLDAEEGPTKAKEILKRYNAKKIPDIDKANYAAVVEDVKALLSNGSDTTEEDDDDFGLNLGGEDDE